jgi:hypothetical protein
MSGHRITTFVASSVTMLPPQPPKGDVEALREVQEAIMLSAINEDTELANRLVEKTRCTKAQLGVFFGPLSESAIKAYIDTILPGTYDHVPSSVLGMLINFFYCY